MKYFTTELNPVSVYARWKQLGEIKEAIEHIKKQRECKFNNEMQNIMKRHTNRELSEKIIIMRFYEGFYGI